VELVGGDGAQADDFALEVDFDGGPVAVGFGEGDAAAGDVASVGVADADLFADGAADRGG